MATFGSGKQGCCNLWTAVNLSCPHSILVKHIYRCVHVYL